MGLEYLTQLLERLRRRPAKDAVTEYLHARVTHRQAAVQESQALGATPAQLAPILADVAWEGDHAEEIAEAIVAEPAPGGERP